MPEQPTAQGVTTSVQIPDLAGMPAVRTPVLDLLRPLFRKAFASIWKLRVDHAERIPDGPVIFAANHVGVFDGPLAVAVSPDSMAMAKKELWESRLLGWALTTVGQIPIDRSNPDPAGIRRCLKVLHQGRRMVIFPEGTRGTGDFSVFRSGVAYLALVSGAPVVPVALVGTAVGGTGVRSIPKPGRPVHVVFGEPVQVAAQEWPRTTAQVADLRERLQQACRRTIQQAQEQTGLELPEETHD